MTHLAGQDIGAVISHYANVIEGDDTFAGIPGRDSFYDLFTDGLISFTADSVDDYEYIVYPTGTWPENTFVPSDTPPFFIVNDTADRARKIVAWDISATKFETKAWSDSKTIAELIAGDLDFYILQGFKRCPDGVDLLAGQAQYDRFFQLSSDGAGERLEISGAGSASYKAKIDLDLRLLKPKNKRDSVRESMAANLAILVEAMTNPDQRSGLVRLLNPIGAATELINDEYKIVMRQSFELIYRIQNSFK